MRKRRRSITIINNEIDYDKLAEAIVKAQRKAERIEENTAETTDEKPKLIHVIKAIFFVITGKAETKNLTNSFFISVISLVFRLFGTIGWIISLIVILLSVFATIKLEWSKEMLEQCIKDFFTYLLISLLSVLSFLYSVMLGVVSFAALVVALIALVKGV